jgi:hypothetical protein
MSDEEFYDDDESGDESESTTLKNLRKQARDGAAAAKERDRLARENAFLKAGIPSTKATEYFQRGYDGDLNAEAIKAAAIEAGFIEGEGGSDQEDVDPDEQAAHERVAEASSGSSDSEPPGYQEKLNAARNQDEVLAVMAEYGSPTANT